MSKILSSFANLQLKIKMLLRLVVQLVLYILVLQVIGILVYNFLLNHYWHQQLELQLINLRNIKQNLLDSEFTVAANEFLDIFVMFWDFQKDIIYRSFYIWLLIPLLFFYFRIKNDKINNNEYIRGAQKITASELNKVANKKSSVDILWFYRLKHCIPFGEVKLPKSAEIKHTFIVGKPGSGKTNAINQMLRKVRQRKQRLIVHDFKGDYVEKFYNPETDIIFNPLDVRSANWCLFNDCQSVMDIEGFAASLIPEPLPKSDPFWNNAARDVMIGVLRYCYASGKTTNKDIWQTATSSNEQLYKLLSRTKGGERGAKHIEDSSGKTAASVMSNFMQYVKVFEYMVDIKGGFSIKQWVENKQGSGMIFITNYAKLQHTLNPIISLFIQTAGRVLMSQSDDLHNRLFFFLDEFGQLQNMTTIANLLTTSRSKGGAVVIGVQDIGQIDKIYGKETRSSILNSAANRVIFNCKDHDTAKFFSSDIGEYEFWEAIESQSLGMSSNDKVNTSRQKRKEFLIMPEEIQSLADLTALVSIEHHSVTTSKFEYCGYPKIAEAFIQRPELDLANASDVVLFEEAAVDKATVPVTGSDHIPPNTSSVEDINTQVEDITASVEIKQAVAVRAL